MPAVDRRLPGRAWRACNDSGLAEVTVQPRRFKRLELQAPLIRRWLVGRGVLSRTQVRTIFQRADDQANPAAFRGQKLRQI